MTTRPQWTAWARASSNDSVTTTPLPAASPSFFTTYGGPKVLSATSASAWVEDKAPSMGAALAYYTVFSMAPLLLIVISVAGLVFGEEAARGELLGELRGLLGDDGAHAVQGLLESVNKPVKSTLATIGSIGALLIGGPEGHAPDVVAAAHEKWSLSPLTLPHMLVRLVVAEQVYRAAAMLANHPYHRA